MTDMNTNNKNDRPVNAFTGGLKHAWRRNPPPPPPLFHLIFQSKRKIGLWHARTAENMKAGRQPRTRTGRQPGRLTACGVVQISTTCFHCIGISQKRRVSNNGGTLQYKSISKSKNGNLQNVTVGFFGPDGLP